MLLTVPLCSSVLSTDFKQTEWTDYEIPIANGIHPNNTYGQLQMGDTLAAVIQKYR